MQEGAENRQMYDQRLMSKSKVTDVCCGDVTAEKKCFYHYGETCARGHRSEAQTEITVPQSKIVKLFFDFLQDCDVYPLNIPCTCGTGGKPSTWFPPGGLEQSFFLLFLLLFCFLFVSLLFLVI